jgi:hypothetical protein
MNSNKAGASYSRNGASLMRGDDCAMCRVAPGRGSDRDIEQRCLRCIVKARCALGVQRASRHVMPHGIAVG